MRVLLVDDEPRVLEGIERMLFELAGEWQLDTAENAELALQKLAAAEFAVVVSDMRMPGMDGAALLADVKELYPRVVRVILSGQTDTDAATRALRVAHRFLAKPCKGEALRDVIARTQQLLGALFDEDLKAAIASLGPLMCVPEVYTKLRACARDDGTTVEEVCDVLRSDTALVAKVLHIANSAFFGRTATSVADLKSAVVRLGMRLLASLALSEGIFAAVASDSSLDVRPLQEHALKTASMALMLAESRPAAQRDEAFTAALVADVGILVLASCAPERVRPLIHLRGEARLAAERVAFGATHAEIGAHVLNLWGLPFSVVEAVANHHVPDRIPRHDAFIAAVVHTADARVSGSEPDPEVADAYGLTTCRARY